MPRDYAREPYEKMARDNPELRAAVTLTITLHANGALSVAGPVEDPRLCEALLANARDALRRRRAHGIVLPGEAAPAPAVPARDTGIVLP